MCSSDLFFSFRWPGQYLDIALGSDQERVAARAAIAEAREASAAGSSTAPGAAPASRAGAARENAEANDVVAPQEAALEQYAAAVTAVRPEWAQLTFTLPEGRATEVRVAVAEGNSYRPDLRWTVALDRASATVASSSGYDDLSTARKLRAWVRYGHTGEVFGIPGQIIATIASAVGVLLVWTGFALAWRRLRQALRRRRRSIPAVGSLPDPSFEPPAPLR